MKTSVRDILGQILPVTNVVMVLLLVYLVYSTFFEKAGQEYQIEHTQDSSQSNTNTNQASEEPVNPDITLERDIFGTSEIIPPQQTKPQENNISQVPTPVVRKPLNLRLLGTVAGDKEIGCAIIENTRTKVQDLYGIGDIVDGARIEKIERNRIILLNNGLEEILNLYVAGHESSQPVALTTTENPVIKPVEPNYTEEDVIKVTSPTERQVNKNAFLAKIGGIEAILKTVQISTHKINGVEDGLLISGLEGLSMAKFIGLKNGDVIQTINGQSVTNDRKAFQVLRKARSLTSFDLELKRGTETKSLSFKID